MVEPFAGHVIEVLIQGADAYPAVLLVEVEGARVALAQQQRRRSFPGLLEPVDPFEFDRPSGVAQFGEHAAPSDRLELAWVTDQGEPPIVGGGEFDQLVQARGAQHARLVDDQRRATRQPPRVFRWPVRPGPFVDEFGDRVTGHPGLAFQRSGCLRGW